VGQQEFGGPWTTRKLGCLRQYLEAYRTIFSVNRQAAWYQTTYVDAFAGTGYRRCCGPETDEPPLFEDAEADEFEKGSARIALEVVPPFDEYVFVDYCEECARELESLRQEFTGLADRVRIVKEDANRFVRAWCETTDWSRRRAVVFLDPYGLEVEWSTIEAIAKTRAIDLWILFPLGQGVVRLLTRDAPPNPQWARRLTRVFGTDAWQEAFYRKTGQPGLFGDGEDMIRTAPVEAIGRFYLDRLKSVFEGVADPPLALMNSKGTPLFLLCFAAGNPKGAGTGIRIARQLMRNWRA